MVHSPPLFPCPFFRHLIFCRCTERSKQTSICPTNTVHLPQLFIAFLRRMGQQSVQRQSSDFTYELRDEDQAEAYIVVAVVRAVAVTISRTAVLPIVVPATAAQHTVRPYD